MLYDRPKSFVLIGAGTLLVRCAEELTERGHEVRCIVSENEVIRRWAGEHGVRVLDGSTELLAADDLQPFDYLASIAHLAILPGAVLRLARTAAFNFHDGPLPGYAGVNAPVWALMNLERQHAVTWHLMTNQVDEGDILIERAFAIAENETSLTLNAKCYEAGIECFVALLDGLMTGELSPRPQAAGRRRHFRRDDRPAAASTISWTSEASRIVALVRALDFGTYANPVGSPKVLLGNEAFVVRQARWSPESPRLAPGTVVRVDGAGVHVRAGEGVVVLAALARLDGTAVDAAELAVTHGVRQGAQLPVLDAHLVTKLTTRDAAWARHEAFWMRRLASLRPLTLPYAAPRPPVLAGDSIDPAGEEAPPVNAPGALGEVPEVADATVCDVVVGALVAQLARLTQVGTFAVGYRDRRGDDPLAGVEPWFAAHVPLNVEIDGRESCDAALLRIGEAMREARLRGGHQSDLWLRSPELRSAKREGNATPSVVIEQTDHLEQAQHARGSTLTVVIDAAGASRWFFDPRLLAREHVLDLQRQFEAFISAILTEPGRSLENVSLLTEIERRRVLDTWNGTQTAVLAACVHELFEAQVERTPDAPAVRFRDEMVTFDELNERANRLAHELRKAGVRPDLPVGLCVQRSSELLVGVLGILKAGGAYVPLDPTYPESRLRFMLEDSGATVLVTHRRLGAPFGAPGAALRIFDLDEERAALATSPGLNPVRGATSENLAYVIYTSGSSGRPKGVMVEHRNVANFLTGMDACVPHDPAGVWLAVTSLSFDISILELLWPLTRGFQVVVQEDALHGLSAGAVRTPPTRPIEFSLFYFASDDAADAGDAYRLLLEGARYADRNGFAAVWTPERHFHAFGGLYPNPAVTAAAIAAVTERVAIRAGSVVLPLHHPVRVAEEWAVVDNLSHGRVGVSFASGWQPDDFVLRPENYADRRQVMLRDLETVRRLWRGESVALPDGKGGEVAVRTHPRPVQPDLPVWLTAAGTPETFEAAGAAGAGVLTHLLGQSVDELADKIAVYREAWRSHGHGEAGGHVTLMLHTFVGASEEEVLATVRKPLTAYLNSSASLLKQYAAAFPAFRGATADASADFQRLGPEEMDALLEHAFQRYYASSGLFGTPQSCRSMIERLCALGVDEVACLIDFGVNADAVLGSLDHLAMLRRNFARDAIATEDYSISAQIRRYGVTHLQCTPSLARLIATDPEAGPALASLRALLVGGEALPPSLATELRQRVTGLLLNMYGPTETTIWSTVQPIDGGPVAIGRPIANTDVYVLDGARQPVPVGIPGELYIGGAGVARGYLGRPELTAERFIPHPFRPDDGARLYRTGDVVRYRADGTLEWLQRMDQQVKLRGFRIELAEIEECLGLHPLVKESAVVLHERDAGEKQLVAFVSAQSGGPTPDATELRAHLAARLPDYMVPAVIATLRDLPLTPNGKTDRRALSTMEPPRTEAMAGTIEQVGEMPDSAAEREVAAVWRSVLGVSRLHAGDNFFELGGDSLSAVRVVARLRESFGVKVSLRHLFETPTVRGLATAIAGLAHGAAAMTPKVVPVERAGRRMRLPVDADPAGRSASR